MLNHLGTCKPGSLCCPITASVIYYYDLVHVLFGSQHDAAYRIFLVERGYYCYDQVLLPPKFDNIIFKCLYDSYT